VTFVANEILEQLEFPWKQLDFPAEPTGGSRHEIQLKIANP
jgi:hypothetical protein